MIHHTPLLQSSKIKQSREQHQESKHHPDDKIHPYRFMKVDNESNQNTTSKKDSHSSITNNKRNIVMKKLHQGGTLSKSYNKKIESSSYHQPVSHPLPIQN